MRRNIAAGTTKTEVSRIAYSLLAFFLFIFIEPFYLESYERQHIFYFFRTFLSRIFMQNSQIAKEHHPVFSRWFFSPLSEKTFDAVNPLIVKSYKVHLNRFVLFLNYRFL